MKFDFHYEYKKDKRGHQHTTCILTSKKGEVLSTGKIIRYHKDDHNRMYAKSKSYTIAYENLQRRLQKPVVKKPLKFGKSIVSAIDHSKLMLEHIYQHKIYRMGFPIRAGKSIFNQNIINEALKDLG